MGLEIASLHSCSNTFTCLRCIPACRHVLACSTQTTHMAPNSPAHTSHRYLSSDAPPLEDDEEVRSRLYRLLICGPSLVTLTDRRVSSCSTGCSWHRCVRLLQDYEENEEEAADDDDEFEGDEEEDDDEDFEQRESQIPHVNQQARRWATNRVEECRVLTVQPPSGRGGAQRRQRRRTTTRRTTTELRYGWAHGALPNLGACPEQAGPVVVRSCYALLGAFRLLLAVNNNTWLRS